VRKERLNDFIHLTVATKQINRQTKQNIKCATLLLLLYIYIYIAIATQATQPRAQIECNNLVSLKAAGVNSSQGQANFCKNGNFRFSLN